ncbi:hypothetical protein HY450_03495 [Candidatus Pacearchaeota archaeon]|nr:hypothetical protein [Candidatus Pacearchaeota archaeon]
MRWSWLIFLFVFLSSISIARGQSVVSGLSVECFPEYKCGSWSECSDGLRSRTCEDMKCNRRNIIERDFCSWELNDCIPKLECGRWSECQYTEQINNVFQGEIKFGGYKTRACNDSNKCIKDTFIEEENCDESFELEINRRIECDEEFIVAIDKLSGREVAKISVDSWERKNLNVLFTQDKNPYCLSCYNGIKDEDEEGIDCGIDCKECKVEKKFPITALIISFWIVSALFSYLSIKELSNKKNRKKRRGFSRSKIK